MKITTKDIKPLFKYIGGKTWLKEKLREKTTYVLENKKIRNYSEPFCGGLGSFLSIYDLLSKNNIENIILSDINSNLINAYDAISKNKEDLIFELMILEKTFKFYVPLKLSEDKPKNELAEANNFFQKIRKEFNENKAEISINQAARLIFLQKHSFNGIYRENLKGEYNTPFNWNGNSMLNTLEDKINELSFLFKSLNVIFKNVSFEKLVFSDDSLIYLDPPYANADILENKYNKELFGLNKQLELIDKIKNNNFIYSNHAVPFIVNRLESLENTKIEVIARKNIISSSIESRKKDKLEILATHLN